MFLLPIFVGAERIRFAVTRPASVKNAEFAICYRAPSRGIGLTAPLIIIRVCSVVFYVPVVRFITRAYPRGLRAPKGPTPETIFQPVFVPRPGYVYIEFIFEAPSTDCKCSHRSKLRNGVVNDRTSGI